MQNFSIVDKLGQANAPGEGHIHYFFDAEPPVMQGSPAVTAAGTYAATTGTNYPWMNVGPGDIPRICAETGWGGSRIPSR